MGDSAICVNPNDNRFHHLRGKQIIVPLCNRLIPVIEDVVDETTKSEPAIEVPAVIEEVAVETLQVIEEVDEVPVEILEYEVVENILEETPEVFETPVVEEIKEVAPPVKVIADTPPVEEKKEEVEWVLPAKIKVEK